MAHATGLPGCGWGARTGGPVTDRRAGLALLGEKAQPPEPRAGVELQGGFSEIYRSEFAYVWRSLRRLGAPPQDLEDLIQETFIRVFRALPDYDPDRPFRPWLFALAFHSLLDFNKRRSRHRLSPLQRAEMAVPDPSPLQDRRLEQEDDRRLVLLALAGLSLKNRAVFVMVELNGHSVPEAAETLGLNLNTAYSRLRLARGDFVSAVRSLTRGESSPAR